MPHPFWHPSNVRALISPPGSARTLLTPRDSRRSGPDRSKYKPLSVVDDCEKVGGTKGRHDPVNVANAKVTKNDVLDWLIDATDDDVLWTLASFAKQRPEVISMFTKLPSDVLREKSATVFDQTQPTPSNGITLSPKAEGPVMEFSSPMFFGRESDGEIRLRVHRIGDVSAESEVSYCTLDDSATAGISYEAVSGILTFKSGESMKEFSVKLIANERWDSTTEFKAVLTKDHLSGGSLGQYLFEARVKMIDDDTFPTNKFKGSILSGDFHSIPKFNLLFEYFRLTYSLPEMRCSTHIAIFIDLVHHLAYLSHLSLSVYTFDFILDTKKSTTQLLFVRSRFESLLMYSGIHLLCVLILHSLEYKKANLSLNGKAKSFLQPAILRKFLNYTQESRQHLEAGEIVMAIDRDTSRLVFFGYQNLLALLSELEHLACMVAFVFIAPRVSGESFFSDNLAAMLIPPIGLLCMPLILSLYLLARTDTITEVLSEQLETETQVVSSITQTAANYNLVLGYSLRNHAAKIFNEFVKVQNTAARIASLVMINNKYFARWTTTLTTCAYVCYGGMEVINGELSLGLFVTNLKVFEAVGRSCAKIFDILEEMQTILPSMINVTKLMNRPTDVVHRLHLTHDHQRKTEEMLETLSEKYATPADRSKAIKRSGFTKETQGSFLRISRLDGFEVDHLHIELNFQAVYSFAQIQHVKGGLNFTGLAEMRQGQIIAIVGHTGSGKQTILKLIAGLRLPGLEYAKSVFVPGHLRAVFVQDTPLFVRGTLLHNLSFGIDPLRNDASPSRIRGICRLLGLEDSIMNYLESPEEYKWNEVLSVSHCKILNLARALINNAEIICMHKPLTHLDTKQSRVAINALHTHVLDRGVMQQSHPLRRPRTVLISSSQAVTVQDAHEIIEIDSAGGLKKIKEGGILGDWRGPFG